MKKKIKIFLLVFAIVVVAAATVLSETNPSSNEHLKVVAEYLSNYDMSQIDLNDEEQAQYASYMSSGANANIMDKVVKPNFQVQDYGLWSVGRIKGTDVTFGIFNKVYCLDKDAIAQALIDRSYNNNE